MQALDLKQEEVLRRVLRDASPLLSLLAEELSMARGTCVRIKVARLVAKALGADIPPAYRATLRAALVQVAREVRDKHGRVWVLADVEAYTRGSKARLHFYRLVYVLDGNHSK
jgi:hypothetical protein